MCLVSGKASFHLDRVNAIIVQRHRLVHQLMAQYSLTSPGLHIVTLVSGIASVMARHSPSYLCSYNII